MKILARLLLIIPFCFSNCYFETSKNVQKVQNFKSKNSNTLFIVGNTAPPKTEESTTRTGVNLQEEQGQSLDFGKQDLSLSIINHKDNTVINLFSDLEKSNEDSLVLMGFRTTKNKRKHRPLEYTIDARVFDNLKPQQLNDQSAFIQSDIASASSLYTETIPPQDTLQDIIDRSNSLSEIISSYPELRNLDNPNFLIDSFLSIQNAFLDQLDSINLILNDNKTNDSTDFVDRRDTITLDSAYFITNLEKMSSNDIVTIYHGSLLLNDGTQLEFFAKTDPLPLLPIAYLVGTIGGGIGTYAYWDEIKSAYKSVKGRIFPKQRSKPQATNSGR